MSFVLDRRKHMRLQKRFKSKIKLTHNHVEFDGITEDMAQEGAFISSPSWFEIKEEDRLTLRLFLPPEMTGQRETLIIKGPAVVRRVEKDRGGIALQFAKQLKTFDVSQ